jgi:NAD(P)-dependent dehydrogenase (short-subunit alcohol dehydrogenase family)
VKAVVFGGTSGMGRAVARRLVERGDRVFLLGNEATELERSAADLKARHPGAKDAGFALCDLERPEQFAPALDRAEQALGGFDTVVVTAALFATQPALEQDLEFTRRLLTLNFAHTVLFCEHVKGRLLAQGGGSLAVFSSVAGDRGRKPVALYGSSKAGLSHYLESLDHKHHREGLHVLTVKPGFVKTGMTAGLKPPPFAGEPDQVARDVVRALDRKKVVLYTPMMWALVMLVIRWLPRFVMRRIGF